MKSTRDYDMRTRAGLAVRTRERILEATIELGFEAPISACTLSAVAERAAVSVQTILRAFGSREQLLEMAIAHGRDEVIAERHVDPADVEGSLASLLDHYERRGDGVILLLGQERWERLADAVTTPGRALHRDWVEAVFARSLDRAAPTDREALVDLLVVATDVYTWKLLRRDRGLSTVATLARVRRLVASVIDIEPRGD